MCLDRRRPPGARASSAGRGVPPDRGQGVLDVLRHAGRVVGVVHHIGVVHVDDEDLAGRVVLVHPVVVAGPQRPVVLHQALVLLEIAAPQADPVQHRLEVRLEVDHEIGCLAVRQAVDLAHHLAQQPLVHLHLEGADPPQVVVDLGEVPVLVDGPVQDVVALLVRLLDRGEPRLQEVQLEQEGVAPGLDLLGARGVEERKDRIVVHALVEDLAAQLLGEQFGHARLPDADHASDADHCHTSLLPGGLMCVGVRAGHLTPLRRTPTARDSPGAS